MKQLIEKINHLKTQPIAETISNKIKEFEKLGKEKEDKVFSELCFCLLTANFQAEKCIQIQNEMSRGFHLLPEKELAKALKEAGHRFWPQRANRIVEARSCSTELHDKIMKHGGKEMRDWLVKNVKGLGMKESSHFLRNIGYKDVAIIDFHIIDLLADEDLIEKEYEKKENSKKICVDNRLRSEASPNRVGELNEMRRVLGVAQNFENTNSNNQKKITLKSKSLSPKKYLEIEKLLSELAKETNTNLAELDLYLWYLETGKVLK